VLDEVELDPRWDREFGQTVATAEAMGLATVLDTYVVAGGYLEHALVIEAIDLALVGDLLEVEEGPAIQAICFAVPPAAWASKLWSFHEAAIAGGTDVAGTTRSPSVRP
jgi:hypothetical protein